MDLKTVDYDELNDKIGSLFWVLFKALIFLGLLAVIAVDIVKYVIHVAQK